MTGLIGFSSAYYAILDCDILLMLGTAFPNRQFYPRGGGGMRIAPMNCHLRRPIVWTKSRGAAPRMS